MLLLTATTDALKMVTSNGSAYDVDSICTYIDRTTSTGAIGAADRQLATATSATTTTIVSAPGSNTTRKISSIFIRNTHATSSVDVLVEIDANGTIYELHKVSLAAGSSIVYTPETGFTSLVDSGRGERILVMSSNVAFSSSSAWGDITGLTCPMKAGIAYNVFACLTHQNNASTTGSRFGFNIGAAPTSAHFWCIDVLTVSASAATIVAGAATARDTSLIATATGDTNPHLALISGTIIPSADGTFAMRAFSEVTVTNGVIVLAGSWMRVFRATGA